MNAPHKAAVRKAAQGLAQRGNDNAALKGVHRLIGASALSGERKREAEAAVRDAFRKMEAGRHPLSDLDTFDGCGACHGLHGAHYFLCTKRKIKPRMQEVLVRQQVERELTAVWRARQQQGAAPPQAHDHRPSLPGARPTPRERS